MHRKIFKQIIASAASSVLMLSAVITPAQFGGVLPTAVISDASDSITINDMPADFRTAVDWIWQNRIEREQSTVRRNTIFDQIVAGKGTVNYIVKWQSYRQLTYEQRQNFEKMLSDCINGWNNWLKGYENWPYEHIDVKIVGWAVIDKNCLLDLHNDEIVYTDTRFYDSQYDTSNGREEIPDKEPYAPSELSRFDHFNEPDYQYPGGLDKRFDMYMWATQGFPDIGGCGGDWGQRLSDTAYLDMINGDNIHVLEHEIGHGFGMTDFYGGEGESDGFPPGGFPGGENSLMMAGSAAKITDFDGWMLRYMWTKIKDEERRFDISDVRPVTTATTIQTTASATTWITTTTDTTTNENSYWEIDKHDSFTDTITDVVMYSELNQYGWIGQVDFAEHGIYFLHDGYSSDDSTNFANYEAGDVIAIDFWYKGNQVDSNSDRLADIIKIDKIELVQNVRETTSIIEIATTTKTTVATDEITTEMTAVTVDNPNINITLWGDANCDNKVTIADATAIIQALGNFDEYKLSEQGLFNADVVDNGDGVTGSDANAVQAIEAGFLNQTDFPIEKADFDALMKK